MSLRQYLYLMGFLLFIGLCLPFCGCRSITPPPNAKASERLMRVTGYCDCGRCCNWERNWMLRPVYASGPNKGKPKKVGITASGVPVRPGTLAADAELFPFGTVMYIDGYGYGVVEDRGADIKGNHIDLYFPTHRQAINWGSRMMKVTVWVPK